MTTLEQYAVNLKRRQNCSARNGLLRMKQQHTDECLIRYARKYPKRKLIQEKATLEFSDQVYLELHKDKVERISAQSEKWRDHWDNWLDEHSQVLDPVVSEEMTMIYSVSESSYSTQGWGAIKYARGDAQSSLSSWAAAFPQLRFELREVFHKYDRPGTTITGERYTGYWEFQVWVNTDAIGCDIIKRRKVDSKEHYRALLKAGCNVKVLYPWLPHGFPECYGLDWHGNDISKETVA